MSIRLKHGAKATAVDPPSLPAGEATLSPRLPRRLPFRYVEPVTIFSDFLTILLTSVISGVGYQWIFLDTIGDVETYTATGILVFANFCALTIPQHNYRPTSLINFGRQLRFVTLTWWFICLALVGIAFAMKISGNFSRGATLSYFVIGWGCLVASRYFISRSLVRALEAGGFAESKIIVIAEAGHQQSSQALVDLRRCGYLPIKTYEITASEFGGTGTVESLREKLDDIISTSQRESVDHVVLLIKWSRNRFIDDIVHMLRILPIPVHLLPDKDVAQLLKNRAVNVGTAWTIELQRAPLTIMERSVKRAFDLICAIITAILLSPLMLITALLIKLDSKGPVLFRQKRNGFNGRTFVIFKFRSMRVLEDGKVVPQATRNDPRITRLGRWLRSTSIDELPQLYNVIIGNMSLVGPRPHACAHNDDYQHRVANYAFRHHMKPGITGWAQINGYRGETQTVDLMERRVENDIWYINHWTLWLDLRILLKTMILVYRQPTAY